MASAVGEGDGQQLPKTPEGAVIGNGPQPAASSEWKFEVGWIGAIGVALYMFLRVPYEAYYESLGVSLEEIGLDYTNLLAQSSGLLSAGAVLSLLLALAPVASATYMEFSRFFAGEMRASRQNKGDANLTARTDEQVLARAQGVETRLSAIAPNSEWLKRQMTRCWELYDLSKQGTSFKNFARLQRASLGLQRDLTGAMAIRAWRSSHRLIPPIALFVFLILLIGVLPFIAHSAAASVRACEPVPEVFLFDLRADAVRMYGSTDMMPRFSANELILLGEGSSAYVLYDCLAGETIRVPISTVVVIDRVE